MLVMLPVLFYLLLSARYVIPPPGADYTPAHQGNHPIQMLGRVSHSWHISRDRELGLTRVSLKRIVFLVTLTIYTPLHLGGALCHNLPTLLACRLLTGIFGSSRECSVIQRVVLHSDSISSSN